MRYALSLFAVVLASSASAQMRGPASWSAPAAPARVASICAFLSSPAAAGVGFPGLVAGLRLSASPAWAPVADALTALGLPPAAAPTAEQFEKALIDASRAVQAGATELTWGKPQGPGATARYAALYGAYMAPHELAALREAAKIEQAAGRGFDGR